MIVRAFTNNTTLLEKQTQFTCRARSMNQNPMFGSTMQPGKMVGRSITMKLY